MRTAILSDIHGNLDALEAVHRAGIERHAQRWICLGDVVGYGAGPAACLAWVQRHAATRLLGNHDQAVAGLGGVEYFSRYAREGVLWTRDHLGQAQRHLLATFDIAVVEGASHYVHAEPRSPLQWDYVCDAGEAAEALDAVEERLLFLGHSHLAFLYAAGESCLHVEGEGHVTLAAGRRYLVNVGSVGQPRDGDARASFVLHDDETDTIDLVRVPYDVAAAGAKILDAGLPRFLAYRLERGC